MKKAVAAFIAIVAVLSLAETALAQPPIWFALNFELLFNPDGTVLIRQKLHPFTAAGESLYGESNITARLREIEQELVMDSVLLLASRPRAVKYEVVSHVHRDDKELVLCDVYGKGEMIQFRGAYVIEVLVYLNTSDFVEEVGDKVFRVRIRDSFTSRDPRSWIDVMEIIFDPQVRLISYSWEPSVAKNATEASERRLLWINYNEPEAPNAYILELYIPGLELPEKLVGYKVVIESAKLTTDGVEVTVKQEGKPGYFFVRVTDEGLDVTRKIYLEEGERKTVFIPAPIGNRTSVRVEVWYEDTLLTSREAKLVPEIGRLPAMVRNVLSRASTVMVFVLISVVALSVAVVFMLSSLARKTEDREKWEF